jgi:hypothetical protein
MAIDARAAVTAVFSGAFSTGIPFAMAVETGPGHLYEIFGGACIVGGGSMSRTAAGFLFFSVAGTVIHWLPLRAVPSRPGLASAGLTACASLALQAIPLVLFLGIWRDCSRSAAMPAFLATLVVGALIAAWLRYQAASSQHAETA